MMYMLIQHRNGRRPLRPVCFKMEQRFRPLRSPDVRAALRAALRARAGGIGEVVYHKQASGR